MLHVKKVEGDKKIGNEFGRLGEDIACRFLEAYKYKIIDRNYRKKWGELDIVAYKDKILHFIEVKAISREIIDSVTHETSDSYRAEDNIHPWKIKRIKRALQTYLEDKKFSSETDWVFDVVTVKIDRDKKRAKIQIIKDLIF